MAPLGPGFRVRRETVTVHYAQRPKAPAVYYRLQAEVRNTGNQPLHLLKIQAPAAHSRRSSASTSGQTQQKWLPVPLHPPMRRGQSRRVPFGYLVPVQGNVVFLEPQEWFPSFLPPNGLFAKAERRAPKTRVDIYVPRGDRVLTSGRLRRVRTESQGAETEYSYELRKHDFPPFLLIGKYEEQKARIAKRDVQVWTFTPMDPACAQSIAKNAVVTEQLYRSIFGRIGKHPGPIRIIQISPATPPPHLAGDALAESVPNGILFSETPASVCHQRTRFFFTEARALAATWFGWTVRPRPGAQAILGTGVQNYAALVAEESREGAGARNRQVKDWIAQFDRLRSRTMPLAPGNLGSHPTGDQLRLAGVQSALCFVALEDRLGAGPVRRALRKIVRSLRRGMAGRDALRSALEWESGKNLYAFLNQWFGQVGIPAAFRKRYSAQASRPDRTENTALYPRRRE